MAYAIRDRDGNCTLLPDEQNASNALAVAEREYPYPNAYDIPATAEPDAPFFDTWTVVRHVQVVGAVYCVVDTVAFGDEYPDDACVIEHRVRRLKALRPLPTPIVSNVLDKPTRFVVE